MANYCSLSTLIIAFFVVYLSIAGFFFYKLMNPLHGIEVTGPTVNPLWAKNTTYDMFAFLSTTAQLNRLNFSLYADNANILLEKRGLVHNEGQELQEIAHNVQLDPLSPLLASIFDRLRRNDSQVYLHVVVCGMKGGKRVELGKVLQSKNWFQSGQALHGSVRLIKYQRIPKHFHHRYLLSDFGLVELDAEAQRKLSTPLDTVISYWKPEVVVKLVSDFSLYPTGYVPESLSRNLVQTSRSSSQLYYKPSLHVDEMGLTSDKYIHLNDTVHSLPLKISIGPMSTQRWLLMGEIERALLSQQSMGFTEKDLDDVRRLITDTSLALLSATILASMLHLYFELLAFQSDISYWREAKSYTGISLRSVVIDLVSQCVVFLFLLNNETSLLVIIPAACAIAIQVWKVMKIGGMQWIWGKGSQGEEEKVKQEGEKGEKEKIKEEEKVTGQGKEEKEGTAVQSISSPSSLSSPCSPSSPSSPVSDYQSITLEADRFAYHLLSLYFSPLLVSWVCYSLVYEKHLSWYSFLIGSLTGFVYAFGFVFMFPQLYINHRLRSVSHLPWKVLVYKFINTFIDDLFAFVVKMPTLHRLSVFRDDIVFLCYLYQRLTYTVDRDRPKEK